MLVNGTDICLILMITIANTSAEIESPYDTIEEIIKYNVLLGFLCVLFYWIAWSTWIVAAEKG